MSGTCLCKDLVVKEGEGIYSKGAFNRRGHIGERLQYVTNCLGILMACLKSLLLNSLLVGRADIHSKNQVVV